MGNAIEIELLIVLFKILDVEIKFYLVYHSRNDRQTKRVNRVLDKYLWYTINYHEDNWVELLPLGEFAYNNMLQGSTQETSFFANYSHNLTIDYFNINIYKNPAATDLTIWLFDIQKQIKHSLLETEEH